MRAEVRQYTIIHNGPITIRNNAGQLVVKVDAHKARSPFTITNNKGNIEIRSNASMSQAVLYDNRRAQIWLMEEVGKNKYVKSGDPILPKPSEPEALWRNHKISKEMVTRVVIQLIFLSQKGSGIYSQKL